MAALRRITGAAALGWLGWRLFGPVFPPRWETPQERPLRVAGRSILVGQREFFVREIGDARSPPLLLVHGWGYDSLATWHRVMEPFAASYRVIAVDQRNHGRSDHLRGAFTIDDLADDLAGVMDALGLGHVPVVGYSMGGMVAQALARRHRGKVAVLVLGATAARPIDRYRVGVRLAFGLGRALGRISVVEWARLTHRYLLRGGAIERRHARWLWESLLDRDVTLAFAAASAIWHFDSRSWAGEIDVPAAVIIPTDDQLIPAAAQYELGALLPDASVVDLVGARHEAVLTHAEEFAKEVLEFLDRWSGPEPGAAGSTERGSGR